MMKTLGVLLLVVVLALAGVGYTLYQRAAEPFRGYAGSDQYVTISQGLGTNAIGARLVDAGVIRDRLTFRMVLWMSGSARHLQAGEYRFDRPMTARDVIDKIARGEVDVQAITFPEGLTIPEMSKIFEAGGYGPAASFVAAARDVSLVQKIDPSATDLEGYIFPDTYMVPRKTDAATLVRLMVSRFETVVTASLLAEAAALGLNARQLVTLASMVEKETSKGDERPLVASVYLNRLKIGMGMQCDPTVIYALQRAGRYDGNLRRDDLMFDSRYNTYRYSGLPPGPIAAPGKASIEASARPAQADYIYFVSRNDGSHAFARTLAEHNANVQRYQVQFFKSGRSGKAGGSGRAGQSGGTGSGGTGG